MKRTIPNVPRTTLPVLAAVAVPVGFRSTVDTPVWDSSASPPGRHP